MILPYSLFSMGDVFLYVLCDLTRPFLEMIPRFSFSVFLCFFESFLIFVLFFKFCMALGLTILNKHIWSDCYCHRFPKQTTTEQGPSLLKNVRTWTVHVGPLSAPERYDVFCMLPLLQGFHSSGNNQLIGSSNQAEFCLRLLCWTAVQQFAQTVTLETANH